MAHLFHNIAVTALSVWGLFSAILIGLSLYQLNRLRNGYVEKAREDPNAADVAEAVKRAEGRLEQETGVKRYRWEPGTDGQKYLEQGCDAGEDPGHLW